MPSDIQPGIRAWAIRSQKNRRFFPEHENPGTNVAIAYFRITDFST